MNDFGKIDFPIVIDSLSSIHYFEFDDSFVDRAESHREWELVYIDRGECEIVADDSSFILKQGELYFHKPGEEHMLRVVKGIAPNIFIMTFTSASVAMCYFENKRFTASMSTKQHIAAILHEASNTFELPFNNPVIEGLKLKSENSLWGGAQTVIIRLELMLIDIIRENQDYISTRKMYHSKEIIQDPFVVRIVEFMDRHLYSKFTLDDLVREFSFGKSYISRYFSKVCGCSVIDYFNMMKINEAKRLIRETNYNFFEISERLSFSNSHYFSTLFRKHTGMTPSQYKKSCKIN